jgi:CRISPR-associated protein Csd2
MIVPHNTPVSKRNDFVFVFDVADGNPNGDPDAGNLPRIDPQSLQGLVTDGCLKRKVRNAIAVLGEGRPGTEIYFQTQDATYEKRVLNLIHQTAWDALGLKPSEAEAADSAEGEEGKKKGRKKKGGKIDRGDTDKVSQARKWMCEQFYDVRAFGAVMTTGVNCGQVRGPVQITFARSVDPILQMDIAITRKSVTSVDRANEQINRTDSDTGKRVGVITGEMGRKNTVPYALYKCYGFVNPYLAKGEHGTGFTDEDLQLLWAALKGQMWEIDRSASRGLMATRGLYVFEHASPLGNAPAHELFDLIQIDALGADAAPRKFDDYKPRITVPPAGEVRPGVTLYRMVG